MFADGNVNSWESIASKHKLNNYLLHTAQSTLFVYDLSDTALFQVELCSVNEMISYHRSHCSSTTDQTNLRMIHIVSVFCPFVYDIYLYDASSVLLCPLSDAAPFLSDDPPPPFFSFS